MGRRKQSELEREKLDYETDKTIRQARREVKLRTEPEDK